MATLYSLYKGKHLLAVDTRSELMRKFNLSRGTFCTITSKRTLDVINTNPDSGRMYAVNVGKEGKEEQKMRKSLTRKVVTRPIVEKPSMDHWLDEVTNSKSSKTINKKVTSNGSLKGYPEYLRLLHFGNWSMSDKEKTVAINKAKKTI